MYFYTILVYFYTMIKNHLHEPFELVLREFMDVCPRGEHAHSFFELSYVVEGTGVQYINGQRLEYRQGDLFLVAPNDTHLFDITVCSRFFFIRFNKVYLESAKNKIDNELVSRFELILQHAGREPGSILKNEVDRNGVKTLVEILIREHLSHNLYHKELISHLVSALLVLVARNVSQTYPNTANEKSDEKILDILSYIQSNIYYAEKLRAVVIAEHFNLADNYLGRYFKKNTGESLQHYILQYKLKLIEDRLLRSNMRIGEIADEFGFTDKSHLSRIFKKHKKLSPGGFRREHLSNSK